ncbi:MAG: glycerol-3-phosphate acyltransferase, partial [Candidatus Sumerlaeota bacterium]|nr:glycerol-3-phosphate acyltransferase [Candidatus Sumerlaeota bacterium]
GFKGGKGVATTLGVFLAAAPLALAIALAIGGVLILATRYVSLGSIAMAVALPGVLIWRQPQSRVLCALAVIAGAVILYRHRGNMARLLRGTENKLFSPPRSTVKNDAP